jgi:hypothetical protein
MMHESTPFSKIVVAVDPTEPGKTALEILRHIANRRGSELLGLFIEDIEILAHAQSRLAREIILSGMERPLNLSDLERQLRAQSSEARRIFERVAAQLGVPHAFQVSRGEVIDELVRMSAGAQILLVGVGTESAVSRVWWSTRIYRLARARVPAVLYAREGWRTGSTVCVVLERSSDIRRAGEAAARLARASNSALTAVLLGEARENQARVQEELASMVGTDPRIRPFDNENLDFAELCTRLYRENARALVMPARLVSSDPAVVGELLARTRCALMLVEDDQAGDRPA